MKNKKTLLFDLILILPIVLVALFFFFRTRNTNTGAFAVVEINNQKVGEYELDKNGEYTLGNGSNKLVVENGYAMITEADCPDKLCVKQGKINLCGQTIVCLPNRLVVYIVQDVGGVDLVI